MPGVETLAGRDELTKAMSAARETWTKFLAAVLLGNGLYVALYPYLPPAARRHRGYWPDLGTLVDFWLCLFVYGLFELAAFLRKRRKRQP